MLAQMGMNTWVRSWVPDCEIVGMAIRHGEAFGLSEKAHRLEERGAGLQADRELRVHAL
jgi:homospermidine synthase